MSSFELLLATLIYAVPSSFPRFLPKHYTSASLLPIESSVPFQAHAL